jgi:hypothetical protein
MDEPKTFDGKAYENQPAANYRKRCTDLNTLIAQLTEKMSGVRSNIEKEFLSAYRVHMLTIQVNY